MNISIDQIILNEDKQIGTYIESSEDYFNLFKTDKFATKCKGINIPETIFTGNGYFLHFF